MATTDSTLGAETGLQEWAGAIAGERISSGSRGSRQSISSVDLWNTVDDILVSDINRGSMDLAVAKENGKDSAHVHGEYLRFD